MPSIRKWFSSARLKPGYLSTTLYELYVFSYIQLYNSYAPGLHYPAPLSISVNDNPILFMA